VPISSFWSDRFLEGQEPKHHLSIRRILHKGRLLFVHTGPVSKHTFYEPHHQEGAVHFPGWLGRGRPCREPVCAYISWGITWEVLGRSTSLQLDVRRKSGFTKMSEFERSKSPERTLQVIHRVTLIKVKRALLIVFTLFLGLGKLIKTSRHLS
jgi:hypothetical protein